jgi:hypothetical protein
MPPIHQPDAQAPLLLPVCPDCLKPMQFKIAAPNKERLLHVLFACDCGRVGDQIVGDMLVIRSGASM